MIFFLAHVQSYRADFNKSDAQRIITQIRADVRRKRRASKKTNGDDPISKKSAVSTTTLTTTKVRNP